MRFLFASRESKESQPRQASAHHGPNSCGQQWCDGTLRGQRTRDGPTQECLPEYSSRRERIIGGSPLRTSEGSREEHGSRTAPARTAAQEAAGRRGALCQSKITKGTSANADETQNKSNSWNQSHRKKKNAGHATLPKRTKKKKKFASPMV